MLRWKRNYLFPSGTWIRARTTCARVRWASTGTGIGVTVTRPGVRIGRPETRIPTTRIATTGIPTTWIATTGIARAWVAGAWIARTGIGRLPNALGTTYIDGAWVGR